VCDHFENNPASAGGAPAALGPATRAGGRRTAVSFRVMADVNDREPGLLAVRRLRASDKDVSSREFAKLRFPFPTNALTGREWTEVVDFVSDQYARWSARFQFSRAAKPDFEAKKEMDAWEQFYTTFLDVLFEQVLPEQVPKLRELMNDVHVKFGVKHLIQRRVRDNEGKPFQRVVSLLFSRAGILANRVGVGPLGRRLYAVGLYPKGTVGRKGSWRPPLDAAQAAWLADRIKTDLAAGFPAEFLKSVLAKMYAPEELDLVGQAAQEKERQAIIDRLAREGKTMSREALLKNFRDSATFDGPDRDEKIRWMDAFTTAFRERYGPEVPVDEVYRLTKPGGIDALFPSLRSVPKKDA
jgi:hypothetical protein